MLQLGTLWTPKGNGGLQLQLCSARDAQIQVGTSPSACSFLSSSCLVSSSPLHLFPLRVAPCVRVAGKRPGEDMQQVLFRVAGSKPRRVALGAAQAVTSSEASSQTVLTQSTPGECVEVSWSTCSHFWAQGDRLPCVHGASVRTPHPRGRVPWETASRGMGTQGTNADLLVWLSLVPFPQSFPLP